MRDVVSKNKQLNSAKSWQSRSKTWRQPIKMVLVLGVIVFGVGSCLGSPDSHTESTASPTNFGSKPSSMVNTSEAQQILNDLPEKGHSAKTGYVRKKFRWKIDNDHNGCDTRNDVLRRDLSGVETVADPHGCVVTKGILDDPYGGKQILFDKQQANLIDIDHVIALSNAWQTGANQWSAEKLVKFANDPLNLLAVSARLNRDKGDGDAATWLPPNRSYRCKYVARQITVKQKYGLWVTAAEKQAMKQVLDKCPTQGLIQEKYVGWSEPK